MEEQALTEGSEATSKECADGDDEHPAQVFDILKDYILKEDLLRKLNFPRPDPEEENKAILKNAEHGYVMTMPAENLRNCRYCKSVYEVDLDGFPLLQESCKHHWAKPPITGHGYVCCGRPLGAEPCSVHPFHLTEDLNIDNLRGFLNTGPDEGKKEVYVMECEMICTTNGLEIAVIAIVNTRCEVIYESMVLPRGVILDCNSRHSGLLLEDFRNVKTTFKEVQSKVFSILEGGAILAGHCLSHDLLRLQIIHDFIVDTICLFPHPVGYPLRRSLKDLVKEFLIGENIKSPSYKLKCTNDAILIMQLILKQICKMPLNYL